MKYAAKIVFLLCFGLSQFTVAAQEDNYRSPDGLNNVFLEIGGAAIKYSISFEKYLYRSNRENFTLTGRVGYGYQHNARFILNRVYMGDRTSMFPFTAQALLGSDKNKLEVGAGFTMLTSDFANREIVPTGVLGLRVMESNGVCFRITYSPLLKEGEFISWFGVSLGYNFSFR